MSLSLQTKPVPLTTDEQGVMRVGDTRVSFDTVIFAFKQGSTPEEIVADYSALDLSDVYAVITFYLQRQTEVEDNCNSGRRTATKCAARWKLVFRKRAYASGYWHAVEPLRT